MYTPGCRMCVWVERETMKCLVCKQAEAGPGKATVTWQRGETTVVIKGALAQVCPNCREERVNEEVTVQRLRSAEQMARTGVRVAIREFAIVA